MEALGRRSITVRLDQTSADSIDAAIAQVTGQSIVVDGGINFH
jgi:hypothetical protein